jgi:hypothetical protein
MFAHGDSTLMVPGWIIRQYWTKIQLVQPDDEDIRRRTCLHLPGLLAGE